MKTQNFDKQAQKFLITPVRKLESISVIDITDHEVPHQLLRMSHIPLYFENKSQTNCTRNTVKYSKVVPNAAVFIVVFQVYANHFILKFNENEFDAKPFLEVIRNCWINFRLRSFLYLGTLWQKIHAAVSYKLVSCMRVLTLCRIQEAVNFFGCFYTILKGSITSAKTAISKIIGD